MTAHSHHPDPATLMSFAAGSLPEPLAAIVAAHVALCPECRAELRTMEMIGAALLERQPAVERADSTRAAAIFALAAGIGEAGPAPARPAESLVPSPIAARYGIAGDQIRWRRLAPGVWHHRLALSPGVTGDLRLLKIGPGRRMPEHGHGGAELTLVLDGAYADETGEYRRGDVQDLDEDIEHTPVADARTGCICLIASERPARFKSFVPRLLQPWTGM